MRLGSKLAMMVVMAGGCVADPEAAVEGGGGGKADGNEQCTQAYMEWLLLELKPAIEAQPLTGPRVTELEALAEQAPCRGELLEAIAGTTWLDLTSRTTYAPYFQQHANATIGFLGQGPARGDLDAYVRASTPTDATRGAWRVMSAARPLVSTDRLGMEEWLDLHQVYAGELLQPLFEPALLTYAEGPWTLNAGEAEFLDLFTQSRPRQTRDGAYAAWVDGYGELLQNGVNIDDTDDFDPRDPRLGCFLDEPAPCGRERFLDRHVALAPSAKGPEDAEQWMWELQLWGSLAATSGEPFAAPYRQQLAHVDRVRPMALAGEGAYRVWLMAVAETASDRVVFDGSVAPAKPCVGAGGDAHHAAFLAENPTLPAEIVAVAAPDACP